MKTLKGGAARSPSRRRTPSQKKRSPSQKRRSKKRIDVSNTECQTPRCVSCRYFALKTYFREQMGLLPEEVQHKLNVEYDRGELDHLARQYNPLGAEELPDDLSVIFITEKGQTISSPLHAFLLEKVGTHYYIHSSWGQSRAASHDEWLVYKADKNKLGENALNHDEYYVNEIQHLPTTHGPFDEQSLKEDLSNIKPNLNKLFGLTRKELACASHTFKNVDLYIFT